MRLTAPDAARVYIGCAYSVGGKCGGTLEVTETAGGGSGEFDGTNGVDGLTAGGVQYLESNVIDAGSYSTMSFTFDWNMNVNGNSDASLHLDAWNGTSWDLDITGGAINTGNNGDVWVSAGPVDLSSYNNADFQLRIRYIVGTAGNIHENDVAVDNLVISGTGPVGDEDATNGVDVTSGSTQYLQSNVLDASTYALNFTFDWNMNVGDNADASLHLDAWNGTSWDLDITGAAINTGSSGDVWTTVGPVDLSSYTNADLQLRIRYAVGNGTTYLNDVAVDNLIVNGTERLGGGSDLKVDRHYSPTTVDPTTGQPLNLNCVECHNPMVDGSANLALIRGTIRGKAVVFTGPATFADGDATYDGICEVCHTTTSHHRNDGSDGTAHNDGADCMACHDHLSGFRGIIDDVADAPHNETANPGLFGSCSVCHDPGTYVVDAAIDNTKCLACHDGVTATLVETHHTPGDLNCTDCHNVMRAQGSNLSHIKTSLATFIANGAGSDFADGSGNGICETCHVGTLYYDQNGTGQAHETAVCTTCHTHPAGFVAPNDPADGPHNETANPGLFGTCSVCHDPGTYVVDAAIDNTKCLACHDGVTATLVETHHTPGDLNCVDCHNPMRAQGTNLSHIRTTLAAFTANGAGSDFADGSGNGICETCHVGTLYYDQNGTGQAHETAVCTTCHTHPAGFVAPIDPADDPHNETVNPGLFGTCSVCHDPGTYVAGATLDNAKCLACHDGVTATQVETHHGGTRFPAMTTNCTDCHNVMRSQLPNTKHIKLTLVSFTGSDYVHGAPNYDGICETCHTQTNQYRNDNSSPVTNHNVGSTCTTCHPHIVGFVPAIDVPPPHNAQLCNTCHTAEPDYAATITNGACLTCHDVSSPSGGTAYDYSVCRTESGTTNILDGNATQTITLGTAIANINQAFLLLDTTGAVAVANGQDHMVSGDIISTTQVQFDRTGNTGQVDISYAIVECKNSEFGVESGQVTLGNGTASNTANLATAVDPARSIVIVSARSNITSTNQSQAHVTGELISGGTQVQVSRASTATGADTIVTYQVVEFSVGSGITVQTGETTLASGQSTTAAVSVPDLSSAWLYFSYDASDDGPQQTTVTGQITNSTTLTFARHANNAYTNRIRWYVVTFPTGEVTVQRGSSVFSGGLTTHNIGISAVSAVTSAFSFVSNTTLDIGGGGGGAPLNQTDDFAGLADGTRPNFGNWTGVNGSDGTNGWVVLSGATGSGSTGPANGNPDPYVYLESSASSQTYGVDVTAGSSQYIESNVIDAGAYSTMSFTFDWNMNVNQNTDASLHLDAWNGSSWDLDITGGAINTGNNGDVWVTTGPVDLSGYGNADFQLRIRYIVGSAGSIFHNDVAVDNLIIDGTGGSPTAYPINRWTEVLSSTSNIQLTNGRGTEADSNASFEWQVVEFTGSGPVTGTGSSLKVDNHIGNQYNDPTTGVLVDLDCVECHNPMYPQTNLSFIRSTLRGNAVVFTNRSNMADGAAPYNGVCEVCHTQTSHYRNDGSSPAMPHNAGSICTDCHLHLGNGFDKDAVPDTPHDTAGFLANCDYCHVTPTDFTTPVPDSKCNQCHTDGGALKGSYPAAPSVLTHSSSGGSGDFTFTQACIDCHNVMYSQPNLSHIRPDVNGSIIASVVEFTAQTGAGSFSDGAPYNDNICDTCHSDPLLRYHHYDGNAPVDQDHNIDSNCTSCHPHNAGFQAAGGDCAGCHSSPAGASREVISEFQGAGGIGHMKFDVANADNATLDATCTQCHGEPTAPMNGAALDVPSWMSPSSTVGSEAYCLECHDGAPAQPFSAGGDTNNPPDISTALTEVHNHGADATCADCHGDGAGNNTYHGGSTANLMKWATQYDTCVTNGCHGSGGSATVDMTVELSGTGGKHPIDGPVTPFSTVMQADTTGTLFVDGWTKDSVAVCGDCHGTNGGGPRGPHGSSYGYILKGIDTTINTITSGRAYGQPQNSAGTGVEQQQNFCVNCHASDVYGISSTATYPTNASLGTQGPGHYADNGTPRLRDRCSGNDGENGRPGITGGPTGLRVACTNCHAGGVNNYGTHSSSFGRATAFSGTGFMNGNSWTQAPDASNCYASTGGNNGWSTCDQGNHN
jgi:hypothetical protein